MTNNTDGNFNFEKLIVYQKSLDYVDFVYDLVKKFPKEEQFDLSRQFKRAAYSVSLNIGEGAKGTKGEFLNFLRIAERSANECVVCSTIATRRKYMSQEENQESRRKADELIKMITGLSKSVQKRPDK